jgi:hypothetical protein
MVHITPIAPAYKKDNGLWSLRMDQLPLPEGFTAKESGVVYIPSGGHGGNHKHPRREVFVGIGDALYLVWQDSEGHTHEKRMMDGEHLYLCDVEPLTPHAVVNKAAGFAVLVELASGANVNVKPVKVIRA